MAEAQPVQRLEAWTGSCPKCGTLQVSPSDTARADNDHVASWSCDECDFAWGVQRGRVV